MSIVHGASVLVSALLLFLVEPMVAKALLPLYGGSPAVWSTCLLFFQGLLLLGYAWAHFSSRRLGSRGALVAHGVLALLPLLLLPPRIPTEGPAGNAWPVPSLLAALAKAVGLPFFVLASNTSLVQKWHSRRDSPWFLYAASNVGSFVALLAYPFAVEPSVGLKLQLRLWSCGYGLFLALLAVSLWHAWRSAAPSEPMAGMPWRRRLRWTARAAVPSSLLLAVSLTITTDVAAIPLLWVAPLALYLATFVIAFWPGLRYPRAKLVLAGAALISASLAWPDLGRHELYVKLGVPLLTLFVGCWICHTDLARDRPEPQHLTDYYLWIAVGGFLGGVFGNLISPKLFHSVAEQPISLALLALLFYVGDDQGAELWALLRRRRTWLRLAVAGVPFVVWMLISSRMSRGPVWWDYVPLTLLAIAIVMIRYPGQFAVAAAGAALVTGLSVISGVKTLEEQRSFFGVARVREMNGRRSLVHGTTRHGVQKVGDPQPVLYYAPLSPLSRIVGMQHTGAQIAVVGLGCGSLAYYTRPQQKLRYYEIDPIIEPMARRWFTFLGDAKGDIEVHLGDARLTLRELPDHSQDVVFVDAFSSDAIPVHLLTVEAIQLYLQKLKPGGYVALHLSNRYLDLVRVPRAVARVLGVSAAYIENTPDPDYPKAFVEMVALAPDHAALQPLLDRGWEKMPEGLEVLWSDDNSSLLSLLVD
jgi:hypothetical protein